MHNLLKVLVVATAALATPALAADLPVKGRPMQQVTPFFSWSGLYLGGQIGYVWGTVRNGTLNPAVGALAPRGIMGGAQIGYNHHLQSNVVLGVELAVPLFSNADDRVPEPFLAGRFYSGRVLYGASLIGRVGYAIDRYLPYAFAGLAYGRGEARIDGGGFNEGQQADHLGWTVGGGLEVALTNNWSAFGRYAYLRMSDQTYNFTFGPRVAGFEAHTVGLGVNYRFR